MSWASEHAPRARSSPFSGQNALADLDPVYRARLPRFGCRFAGMRRIVTLVYVVAGVAIAASHHYFAHASTLKPILSAVLAIALWPLLLLGISLHIT